MEKFSKNDLESIIGEEVSLGASVGPEPTLRIDAVDTGRMDGPEWESFVVRLSGCEQDPLPQGNYQVKHREFGEQTLFISPNSETEYEIVVNKKRS